MKVPSWVSITLGITTLGLAAALGVVASTGTAPAPARIVMPQLVGAPYSGEASVHIEARHLGLALNLVTVSRCLGHGQGIGVLSQSPASGTPIEAGSTVSATWSTVTCH
jgi:hypothetical protein